MPRDAYQDWCDFQDEIEFVAYRGMSTRDRSEWLDRNQQTIEGNMAQREERLEERHNAKLRINISEQLFGESRKKWIGRWGRV